jgi:hypothetical protein
MLRFEVVQHMRGAADKYLPVMPDIYPNDNDTEPLSWVQYLDHIATPGIWCDELPISAASAHLQVRINFYWCNPQTNRFERYGHQHGQDLQPNSRVVNLFYISQLHFEVLPFEVVTGGLCWTQAEETGEQVALEEMEDEIAARMDFTDAFDEDAALMDLTDAFDDDGDDEAASSMGTEGGLQCGDQIPKYVAVLQAAHKCAFKVPSGKTNVAAVLETTLLPKAAIEATNRVSELAFAQYIERVGNSQRGRSKVGEPKTPVGQRRYLERAYGAQSKDKFRESEEGVRAALREVCAEARRCHHKQGETQPLPAGASVVLTTEQLEYIEKLRQLSVIIAEYEQATLLCGFPAGSRTPSIPDDAFDSSSNVVFGIGSYAPMRQYLQMILRNAQEDGIGGVFNGSHIGLALNALLGMSRPGDPVEFQTCLVDISVSTAAWEDSAKTKQVNTAEVFGRFNEATQHHLLMSAYYLLQGLHDIRAQSGNADAASEHLFCMGAFAREGHALFCRLADHHGLHAESRGYVNFLHFMQVRESD